MSAALKLPEPRTPLGYKATRTTVVLASSSSIFAEMQARDVRFAFDAVREQNFDLERVDSSLLEIIYSTFDEELMKRVVDEYTFRPGFGNIKNYGANIGICELCGKGDSRDDGENRDKLRYAFKLSNVAGGTDVWCGSTCIINHALKVEGAATAEEARAILEKSMREHLAQWKIETWRVAHPDHADIPALFDRMQRIARYGIGPMKNDWRAMSILEVNGWELASSIGRCAREFRSSVRFYKQRGHLTDKKMRPWLEAKALIERLEWLTETYESTINLHNEERDTALAHALKLRKELLAPPKRVRIARPIL